MKIAVFEPKFLTPRHYAVSYLAWLQNLVRELTELGNEVLVLTEGSSFEEAREGYKIYPLGGQSFPSLPFGSLFSAARESMPLFAPFFSPRIIFRAAKILKELRVDVIYTCGTPLSAASAALLGSLSHIPVLHHVSLIPSRRWWRAALIEGYKTPLRHLVSHSIRDALQELVRPLYLARWGLRHVDGVVASSNYIKTSLGEFGLKGEDIPVVYPGVSIPPIQNGWEKDAPVITYFGHLWQGRGVLDLLQAFSRVVKQFPRANLVVAPTDINRLTEGYFRKLKDEYGLDSSIVWKGIVNDVYSELLAPSTVIVLPYRNAASIKLVESMAAAKPVVTTGIEWVPEIISDGVNGFLVTPGDVEGIASKVAAVLGDGGLAQEMGKRALETVAAKCSVQGSAKALQGLLEKTAGQPIR